MYPAESFIELEEDLDENDNQEWTFEDDWPYGEYKTDLEFKKADAVEGEDGFEFRQLPDEIKFGGSDKAGYFASSHEPQPVSEADQKKVDEEEEKQNKQKEQNARLAQKELESKKAQQKVEAQMQLLKQEQNSAKLKVYFSVMNLYFHK